MPQVLGKLIEVQAAQDVIEGFSAHIRAEDLAPARFQFAVAAFAQEGERAQLLQFIAQARVLALRCGGLIFQLAAQHFHFFIGLRADFLDLHLDLFELALNFLAEFAFQLVQAFLDGPLNPGNVLGGHRLADIGDERVRGRENHLGDQNAAYFFLQRLFQALAFLDDRFQARSNLFIAARFHLALARL